MKKYTTWLKTAAIIQFLAAIIHATSLFISPPPNNETEKQLFTLMDTYQFDFGAGFHRTMNELTLVLSSCLCLLCLLGGLINWYLLKKKTDPGIIKGVININLVVFIILFVLTIVFAFWIPIIQVGLIVLLLIPARFTIPKKAI